MSGPDDRTKLAPTPPAPADPAAGPRAGADDPTQALPRGEDATRVVGADDPTRRAETMPADERTRAVDAAGGGEDATVAVGQEVGSAPPALDDDVTIVRPAPRRRPRLLVRSADGRVEERPLAGDESTIGRASGCQVVLANPEVSREHARIVQRPDGSVLQVIGARRNTRVNGQLVDGEHLLRHGDVLELASARAIYAETEETPRFEGAPPPPGRQPIAMAALAAVAVAIVGAAIYVLGPGRAPAPPPPAPVAAPPPPQAVAPAVIAEIAPAAAAAAREAAEQAVREAAEQQGARLAAEQREERIRKLLYEGDIAFLENQLTTPADGSASYAYSEVLKLDPANARAREQIVAIIEKYLGWAETARARGNRRQALLYAGKARYVHELAPEAGDRAAIEGRIAAAGG